MKQIFIILFILLCAYFFFSLKSKLQSIDKDTTYPIKYYRFNNDATRRLPAIKTMADVFEKHDIVESITPQDADILFLDKFDHQHIFKNILMLNNYINKYLYTLVSIDYLSSKSQLYEMLMT